MSVNKIDRIESLYCGLYFLTAPFREVKNERNLIKYSVNPDTLDGTYLETPDSYINYSEIKRIFLPENGNEELITENINELLKIVIEIPELMKPLNHLIHFFGGVSINSSSTELIQKGGSKNFNFLFLFSLMFLLFLKPVFMFSINSNVRTTNRFPNNNNQLSLPSYVIMDNNYDNNQYGHVKEHDISKQLQLEETNPGIEDKLNHQNLKIANYVEGVKDVLENTEMVEKIMGVFNEHFASSNIIPIVSDKLSALTNKVKAGVGIAEIISINTKLSEKVDILISDVLGKNKLELGLAITQKLAGIINKFPTRLIKGLEIASNINGLVTSAEFEVISYAAKYIFEKMGEEIIEKSGSINPNSLHNYIIDATNFGGKQRRSKYTIKKKKSKKNKMKRKSKRRKHSMRK